MTYEAIVEQAAKILAALHSGILKFDCDTCTQQKQLNCNMNVSQEEPVYYNGEIGDVYTCPIKLIPEWVMEWYEEYHYGKMFNSSPNRDDILRIKWHFFMKYERYYNQYQIKKTDQSVNTNPKAKKNALNKFRKAAGKD